MAALVKRAVALLALAFVIPLGCRGVLGIEERELVAGVSCDTYCHTIQANCTGADIQYASMEACTKMCATFTPGTLDDDGVDTLGCRQQKLVAAVQSHDLECQAVGPDGSACGTPCDLYCKSLEKLCLEQFAAFQGNCLAQCALVPTCGTYTADGLRDDNSLECRLFHLTSAAFDANTHCDHAVAKKTHCLVSNGSQCVDAGSGSGGAGTGGAGGAP